LIAFASWPFTIAVAGHVAALARVADPVGRVRVDAAAVGLVGVRDERAVVLASGIASSSQSATPGASASG
jgi:hypothetical protein